MRLNMLTHRKLRVFDTVHDVYAFIFRDFGTIVRLSWFPLLLSGLAAFYATKTATVIATEFFAVITWAIVAPSWHRLILSGDRQPGTFLNLRFGKVEALFALPLVLLFLTILTLELLGVPLKWHVTGGAAMVVWGIMAVMIFFSARFCLAFPIAVLERRVDFAQAWALSHGNVWRMIAVWIVVTTPAYALIAAVQWLLLTVLKVTPWTMMAKQFEGSLLEFFAITWPTSILIGALCVGILSYTYKALAGFAPDATLTPISANR